MTKRSVTFGHTAKGNVTTWVTLEDGTRVLASLYTQQQIAEYLATGAIPKPKRAKSRPKLQRDDACVALHYTLLLPQFQGKRGGAKTARGQVATAWGISDQRVSAANRIKGSWARSFVATEPADQHAAMLRRIGAYATEYAQDLKHLDHRG